MKNNNEEISKKYRAFFVFGNAIILFDGKNRVFTIKSDDQIIAVPCNPDKYPGRDDHFAVELEEMTVEEAKKKLPLEIAFASSMFCLLFTLNNNKNDEERTESLQALEQELSTEGGLWLIEKINERFNFTIIEVDIAGGLDIAKKNNFKKCVKLLEHLMQLK